VNVHCTGVLRCSIDGTLLTHVPSGEMAQYAKPEVSVHHCEEVMMGGGAGGPCDEAQIVKPPYVIDPSARQLALSPAAISTPCGPPGEPMEAPGGGGAEYEWTYAPLYCNVSDCVTIVT
jgi:hypothetical protein